MTREIEFFEGAQKIDHLILIGGSDLNFFFLQTSASIIQACKEYKYFSNSPILNIIKEKCTWAEHGYTNCLLSQVKFIYFLVEFSVINKHLPYMMGGKSIELLTDALQAFQNYKTYLIEEEQKEMGKNWGAATNFNTMDWTKYNKEFLELNKI